MIRAYRFNCMQHHLNSKLMETNPKYCSKGFIFRVFKLSFQQKLSYLFEILPLNAINRSIANNYQHAAVSSEELFKLHSKAVVAKAFHNYEISIKIICQLQPICYYLTAKIINMPDMPTLNQLECSRVHTLNKYMHSTKSSWHGICGR